MKKTPFVLTLFAAAAIVTTAHAQETKVGIGISGWTGFAPLTLAKEAGIFKKNGLDVSNRKGFSPRKGKLSADSVAGSFPALTSSFFCNCSSG